MDTQLLERKFDRIGARLRVSDRPPDRRRIQLDSITLNVRADREGEFFEIVAPPGADNALEVLDVRPDDRHLLLLLRDGLEKHKYLCGHDERHWFVAAIPESAGGVGTVPAAKDALKPPAVRDAAARAHLRGRARNRRKNAAYVRQGEWFFVPAPAELRIDPRFVLHNEPIRRGNGGKPHWVDHCYRTGGVTVYVCSRLPNGITGPEYKQLLADNPDAIHWRWRVMLRDAEVYARGRVRHADHRVITLHTWHRVFMNTENQALAMRHVAFLD